MSERFAPAGFFDLAHGERPPPTSWVVQELIPEGFVTNLYGKTGSKKSMLALMIAFHVSQGLPFLGLDLKRGKVLYLDAEMNLAEFRLRAFQLAKGWGLARPPADVIYHRLEGPLSDPAVQADVRAAILYYKPRLVIVDSFSAALPGRDSNSLDDVTARVACLSLGTVLVLDHMGKSTEQGGARGPIGSSAKTFFARSVLSLRQEDGSLVLQQEKSNFGAVRPPIRFRLDADNESIALEGPVFVTASPASGESDKLKGKIIRFLEARTEDIRSADMARELAENLPSVRNTLTALRKAGLVEMIDKKWRLANLDHSLTSPKELVSDVMGEPALSIHQFTDSPGVAA